MDSSDAVSYVVSCVILALLVLAALPPVRVRLVRLGTVALERMTAEPEIDQDALDLYEAVRRERLLGDVARLRRVLAHDEHMSAVRQIGNRMAYDRLLLDLSEIRDLAPSLAVVPQPASGWSSPDPLSPSMVLTGGASAAVQYRPKVETLDLGWRR